MSTIPQLLPPESPSFLTKLANWCQGRTQMWLVGFFINGHVLHYLHRLDATYISFMVTFMGIALGHSIKEDWFQQRGQGG